MAGLEIRRRHLSSTPVTTMPDARELPERLLEPCRILPSREHLLAQLPKGGMVAEIGVADGDFSAAILKINEPSRLVLVDAWDSDRYRSGFDRVSERFSTQITAGTVQIERGLSTDVMRRMSTGAYNWVYLDTVHDYSTTKTELDLAAALVAPGGYIAGHDFCLGNPTTALPYGVIPAVCEFCVEREFPLAYLTLAANGYFSFCISAIKNGKATNGRTILG